METIVCRCCDEIIDHLESDKVGVLYGICSICCKGEQKNKK